MKSKEFDCLNKGTNSVKDHSSYVLNYSYFSVLILGGCYTQHEIDLIYFSMMFSVSKCVLVNTRTSDIHVVVLVLLHTLWHTVCMYSIQYNWIIFCMNYTHLTIVCSSRWCWAKRMILCEFWTLLSSQHNPFSNLLFPQKIDRLSK